MRRGLTSAKTNSQTSSSIQFFCPSPDLINIKVPRRLRRVAKGTSKFARVSQSDRYVSRCLTPHFVRNSYFIEQNV